MINKLLYKLQQRAMAKMKFAEQEIEKINELKLQWEKKRLYHRAELRKSHVEPEEMANKTEKEHVEVLQDLFNIMKAFKIDEAEVELELLKLRTTRDKRMKQFVKNYIEAGQ